MQFFEIRKFTPNARHRVAALLLLLLCSGTSLAQTSSMLACRKVIDREARLGCYDSVIDELIDTVTSQLQPEVSVPVNTTPGPAATATPASVPAVVAPVEKAVAAQAVAAPPPAAAPAITPAAAEGNFGLEAKLGANDREMNLRVSAARYNKRTGWTLEFDNAGTWRQKGNEPYDIVVGETYTIRRSSLGSYMLSNSHNNLKMRVTRVE